MRRSAFDGAAFAGIICAAIMLWAASPAPRDAASPAPTAPLLINVKDFSVAVLVPDGWLGYVQQPQAHGANAVFFPANQQMEGAKTVITVRVWPKTGQAVSDALAYDMEQYKRKYPSLTFEDLSLAHQKYRTFSKIYTLAGQFSDYVTYVDPGQDLSYYLVVTMETEHGVAATKAELAAYKALVKSVNASGNKSV